jgi:hypothetical protein
MEQTLLATFKEGLRRKGFEKKAVISDEEMEMATRAFADEEGVLDTPADELRYIEGLLNLPLGFIDQFKFIPAAGYERCACGRTPSALDITYTAMKRRIHDKETIRDILIGFSNLVELADDGRTGECFNCGRLIQSRGYWTRRYMYA